MTWYAKGTFSNAANSAVITGTGTEFTTAKIRAGDGFIISNEVYEIKSVDSETQLTLVEAVATANTNATYSIIPITGAVNSGAYIEGEVVKAVTNALRRDETYLIAFSNMLYDPTPAMIDVRLPDGTVISVPNWALATRAANTQDWADALRVDMTALKNSVDNSQKDVTQKATNAADSATLAGKWAENPEDSAVVPGKYSAKHHAIKAGKSATQADTDAQATAADRVATAADRVQTGKDVVAADGFAAAAAASAGEAAQYDPTKSVVYHGKIPAGDNINNYTPDVAYRGVWFATAGTLALGYPVDGFIGTLEVFTVDGSGAQRATDKDGQVYFRWYQSAAYGAWNDKVSLPVSSGGTGAKNASDARKNLGVDNLQKMFLYSFFNSDGNTRIDLATSSNARFFNKITSSGMADKQTLSAITGRDPSIIFYKGYWLIAVTGYSPNSYDAVVWKSKNLLEWEKFNVKFGASAVTGTTLTGGGVACDKIWAPEWVVDGGKIYLLSSFRYYADSTDKNNAKIPSFKPFYAECKNLETLEFSAPVALALPDNINMIDPSIFRRASGGSYFCVIKDENWKNIRVYKSDSFTGAYTYIRTIPFDSDCEGPCVVEMPGGDLRVYADFFSTDFHCHYIDTIDFTDYWNQGKILMNSQMRHGTIVDVTKFDNPTLAIQQIAALYSCDSNLAQSKWKKLSVDAGGSGSGDLSINPAITPIWWKPVPGTIYYTDETDGVITINNLPTTYPDGSHFYLMVNSAAVKKGVVILKAQTATNGIFNPSGADYYIQPLSYQSKRLLKMTSVNGVWVIGSAVYGKNFIVSSDDNSSSAAGSAVVGGQVGSRLQDTRIGNGSSLFTMDARAVIGTADYGCLVYRNWAGVSRTWNFESGGNATATGGSWNNSSDENIKDNIKKVESALEAVLSWRGVTWDYKAAKGDDVKNSTFGVGLIAQDVEKSCPGAVYGTGKREFADGTIVDNVKALNVSGVAAAYHTEAIKELYAMILEIKESLKK